MNKPNPKVNLPFNLENFLAILNATIQEPQTELFYTNTFTLLVAVVLSAQATDAGVNKVTPTLFKKADTPAKMLALGIDGLKKHTQTIGLYPTKSKHIIALSQRLINDFQGKVPPTREALMTLPGVGRKTANVILNVAFDQPTIPVDTHVFRVMNRTALSPGKTTLEVEKQLEKNTPKPFLKKAHHLILLHGRYTCKARNPLCHNCAFQTQCPAAIPPQK